MSVRAETGLALVVTLLAMVLLSGLIVALLVTTSSETVIAANFRRSREVLYAADAGLGQALSALATLADWNQAIGGLMTSGFIDGPPSGVRVLADGARVDLDKVVSLANCGKTSPCTDGEMDAVTADRPWGANNPRWRLYAYGPLGRIPTGDVDSSCYVVVLVGDDQSESDGNPRVDGVGSGEVGAGVILLHAEAFGPRNAHKTIELSVARVSAGVRVLSWREVR